VCVVLCAYVLFEVRVAGFIFNNKKELLLLKNNQGTWGILGGHLEKNEEIENTMQREAFEEAQVEATKNIALSDLKKEVVQNPLEIKAVIHA
jgi:ADP-ribose pyrophosphatase YjhB (NUDIX family)